MSIQQQPNSKIHKQSLDKNTLWLLFTLSNHCGENTTLLTTKRIQSMAGLGRDITRKSLISLSKNGYILDNHNADGREIKVKKILTAPTENQEGLLEIRSAPLLEIRRGTENQEGLNNNKAYDFTTNSNQKNNLDMPKKLEKCKKTEGKEPYRLVCNKPDVYFHRAKWVSEKFEKNINQYLENNENLFTVNVMYIIYTIVIYNILFNNRLLKSNMMNNIIYSLITYSTTIEEEILENFESEKPEEKYTLKEKEKETPQVAAAPPKKKKKDFTPPSFEDLVEMAETTLELDSVQAEKLAEDFHHHYTKTEWKVGAGYMKNVGSALKKFMRKKDRKPILGFSECKEWWMKSFPEQFFDGREAGALKLVIEKLTHTFRVFKKDDTYTPDSSETFLSFKRLVEQRPNWLKTPSISSLNSNYNTIITHIKQTGGIEHGTAATTTRKRSERTADEIRQDTLDFLAKERARKESLRQKYGSNS